MITFNRNMQLKISSQKFYFHSMDYNPKYFYWRKLGIISICTILPKSFHPGRSVGRNYDDTCLNMQGYGCTFLNKQIHKRFRLPGVVSGRRMFVSHVWYWRKCTFVNFRCFVAQWEQNAPLISSFIILGITHHRAIVVTKTPIFICENAFENVVWKCQPYCSGYYVSKLHRYDWS